MLLLTVNGKGQYEAEIKDSELHIDLEGQSWDIVPLDQNRFHVLVGEKSYEAQIEGFDKESKTFEIKIGQNTYSVAAKDRFDLLLEEMGMEGANSTKINDIKAPMPGLVVSIQVKPGDSVVKGDGILILEAMKMENVLKSPGEGVVKKIMVKQSEAVEKGQVLLVFE